jgi:hypothetical protein
VIGAKCDDVKPNMIESTQGPAYWCGAGMVAASRAQRADSRHTSMFTVCRWMSGVGDCAVVYFNSLMQSGYALLCQK